MAATSRKLPERFYRDVWLLIITGTVLWALVAQQHETHRGARAATALCALRHDLKDRVANSEQFLKGHPHGIPGIPAKTIRQSVDGQRRTVEALSILKCT